MIFLGGGGGGGKYDYEIPQSHTEDQATVKMGHIPLQPSDIKRAIKVKQPVTSSSAR